MKIAGLGIISLLVVVLGLAIVAVGLGLGAISGQVLGGMVGIITGMGAIYVGYFMLEKD